MDCLAFLRARGLADDTIRRAHLGYVSEVAVPTGAGSGVRRSGVAIPWFDGQRLTMVKLRQPDGVSPKYVEVYRDEPTLFPGRSAVIPGRPLVIVEGELDTLLLGEQVGDLVSVVTLGSASSGPHSLDIGILIPASPWFIALDNDACGHAAAERWLSQSKRARRVRPPVCHKDWTEAHLAGVNLRRWWADRLAGNEAPELFTWPELSTWRWGLASLRDTECVGDVDEYATEERLAIQSE
jgi:hypothetical protein